MNNMDYLWIFDKVWDLVAMAHGRMLVEFCPVQESLSTPTALEGPEIEEIDNILSHFHQLSNSLGVFAQMCVHL